MQQAERDVEPALHAAGVRLGGAVGRGGEVEALEQLVDAPLQPPAGDVVDLALQDEVLAATGRENLVLQGQIYDVTGRRLKRRVSELLERFDLTGAANRAARHYSGGMQRRLDIALGLLHEPEVLFLDEPTTGLDPEARAEMWKEIGRLTEQERLTILLTTHYLEEADELAAQLAIVDRGRVVAAGTPDELKSSLEGDSLQVELAECRPTARCAVPSSACLA